MDASTDFQEKYNIYGQLVFFAIMFIIVMLIAIVILKGTCVVRFLRKIQADQTESSRFNFLRTVKIILTGFKAEWNITSSTPSQNVDLIEIHVENGEKKICQDRLFPRE